MNEQNFTYPIAPTYPLHQLITLPFEEEAKEIMLKHGCTLEEYPDECIIIFPEGTTRTEIFPPVPCTHDTGLSSLMDINCVRSMTGIEKLAYSHTLSNSLPF
jgi:hypothetical protein